MGEKAIPILGEYMGLDDPGDPGLWGLCGVPHGRWDLFLLRRAPEPDPDHALHAVQSVCTMHSRLDALNESFTKRGLPPLGMRVGVTTGMVIIGDGGCPPQRSDYTALGDSVNLAARLETANKLFGDQFTDHRPRTVELLNGSYLVRPIANLRVKGKEKAVVVFEPLCTAARRHAGKAQNRGVHGFDGDRVPDKPSSQTALPLPIAWRREIATSKKLAALYRDLAQQYLVTPPENFDGGVTLTEK